MMDIWRFDARAGQFTTLEIWVDPLDSSSPDARFGLDVTSPDDVRLTHEAGSVSLPPYVELKLPTSGTYHVCVIPLSGSLGRYSLLLTLTDEAQLTGQDATTGTVTVTSEATVECRTYTVEKDDTVWDIALAFGVTVEAIVEATDHLTSPDEIHPGIVLCIPAPPPTPTPLPEGYYVVQFGDTLWSLAWKFECTIEDWIAANAGILESPHDILAIGQALRMPDHSSVDDPLLCARVPERRDVITYTVRQGESLICVANKFGISMATIQWANRDQLSDSPNLIYAGDILTILPVDGVLHAVAEGETLEGIAQQYLVEVAGIVDWGHNRLTPESKLTVGQEIVIPNGIPPLAVWAPPVPPVPGVTPQPPGPGVTPSPTVPGGPAPSGAIQSRHDPWYSLSWYDTGYCPNPPPGWGWSGSLSWPVHGGQVDQSRIFTQWHPAIDIDAPVGSPVYAAETGVAIWAGYNTWGYGNLIILAHGSGWRTFYSHLADVYVGCGQTVTKGEMIGTVGQTGQASCPHLHFELRRNGYNYNPLNWLP
jgi:murein DD-endopeptidase MepM/ murein hydrolase activator NlpD